MTVRPEARRASGGVAGEVTVRAFEAELRRYVRRRVPGPDGDDVAQDALVRVYLGADRLRAGESLPGWVYRVARSAIVDHHRRASVRRRVTVAEAGPGASPDALPDLADEGCAPEVADEVRAGLAACVEPFLRALPAAQAEALRLTDLGGASQVEAAARLGVPLPTFKARVQRGRRALRAEFDACCAFVLDGRGAVVEATPRCSCP